MHHLEARCNDCSPLQFYRVYWHVELAVPVLARGERTRHVIRHLGAMHFKRTVCTGRKGRVVDEERDRTNLREHILWSTEPIPEFPSHLDSQSFGDRSRDAAQASIRLFRALFDRVLKGA
jgi:hypothetical protein